MRTELRAKVRFYGDNIGFQFNKGSNGSRVRIAKVSQIKLASDDTLALIKERYQRRSEQTVKSHIPTTAWWNAEFIKVYEGIAQFSFDGESPRIVIVVGNGYFERLPDRWESITAINEG